MEDIDIRGVWKSSLIDYPGKIVSVLFTNGCNFRCGFCQNPELVEGKPSQEKIPPQEILDFLESRRGWIDGVCITGGEPCLQPGLTDFCREVKKRGFLVKLDTNGSRPDVIKKLIENKIVDYIAMDIKGPPEDYEKICNAKVNMEKIQESIDLIRNSGIDYEFRTTAVPGLFDASTAKKIGEWLKGAKKFSLQQFSNSSKVLDPKFQEIDPYLKPKLEEFRQIMKNYFTICELRNI